MLTKYLSVFFISMVPLIELRGAIPVGVAMGLPLWQVYIIAIIGNIDFRVSEDQLEELGLVDIVIVPVGGGGYTLDATNATVLVRKIDCKVAIPVHYADKAAKYEAPQEDVSVFVKEFGGQHEVTPKYKVKSASSVPAATTVIEITRS